MYAVLVGLFSCCMCLIIFGGIGMWRGAGLSIRWSGRQGYRLAMPGLLCVLCVALTACNRGIGDPATDASASPTAAIGTTHSSTVSHAQHWDDWFTYHHDNARSGYVAQTPDPQKMALAWNVHLDGAVYAQPLMVKDEVIVATEQDSLYALDPATGKTLWRAHVGTSVAKATLPCGDIDPLGITGTPVYDPVSNLIFAVAEVTGPQHVLVAVDATTGQIRQHRVIDVAGMDPTPHQERAALALANNTVYIAFGGLAGDCGDYIGTVVAASTSGSGNLLSYRVPTSREGGIWAVSGPAIDSAGHVYVSVGNGAAESGNWDHSDSVLRLSPQLQLEDAFAPQQWASENASDTDLGSTGPLLLPNGLVFIAGKSGAGYVVRADSLGGIGGQVSTASICNGSYGGAVAVDSSVLVPCNDGVTRIDVDGQGQISVAWHDSHLLLPPTVGGHTVYSLNGGGTLFAADIATGKVRTQVEIGDSVPHFDTPMLSNHSVFIGTMHGIAAVTLS